MELQNGEQAADLLHCQAHVWNHAFSFIKSISLKCAIQLEIPDIIHNHGGPMTLSQLVDSLPMINKAKAHGVYRLMRVLVHSGFFFVKKHKIISGGGGEEEEEEEGYLVAPAGRLLLKDEQQSMRPNVLMVLDPIMTKAGDYVSEWFQNESPTPFHTAHGRTIYEYAEHEPKFNQLVNETQAGDSRLVLSLVIRDGSAAFEGLDSIVNVGGGTGTMSKAIADAFPHLKNCVNFDLPHVVAGLEGSKNLSFVGGDMFVAIPAARSVLLQSVLRDWGDEECIKILKRCKEAIPSKENGGKVIIIDGVLDNHKVDGVELTETELLADVMMMVVLTGKERNEKHWAKLFSDSSFSDYKITPILSLTSLIEVYP